MTLIIFLTKVVICSAALFGYYFLFLRDKQFHQYNRYYLLIGVAFSFLFPLLQIPVLPSGNASDNVLIKTLKVITVSGWQDEFVVTPYRNFTSFKNIALVIYLTGFVILTIYLVKFFVYIKKLSQTYKKEQIGSVNFYNTEEPGTPFSFFNALFWNEKILLTGEKGQHILQHELFHIHSGHSYDLFFMKIVSILFWFNPFYHLFMKEIKAIHEFLADEHASSSINKYDYAELLVTEAIHNRNAFLSNEFFHTQIKRRIIMLIKHNPSSFSYLRRIMALPLLLILFCAFSLKTVRQLSGKENFYRSISDTLPASEISKIKPEDIKIMNVNKDLIVLKLRNGDSVIVKTADFLTANAKVIADTIVDHDMIFTQSEIEATFPGGAKEWIIYLNKNFKYPKEAQDKEIQGTVIVQFLVDKDGAVSKVQALSGPESGGLKEESIRIIKNSGKWIPGKQNGVAVTSYKKQPITYRLERQ